MDPSDVLSCYAPFAAACPDRRAAMLRDAAPLQLPAGFVAFSAGSPCASVVFVGAGRIRVCRTDPRGREITLYHVDPGETCLLTLGCALSGDPYPADAVVEEPVDGAAVPVERFRAWFDDDSRFRQFVIRTITGRVVELMELVEVVAFHDARTRLAHFLATADGPGGRIPATHDMIAAELGSSRETVSRLLKEYERAGAVELGRGSVRVVDPTRLVDRHGVV